ncbi:potassium transporter Kup [Fructilactobacillus lindneri]|uniref:Probable potassium transport system protein Kup n=1 Tax=Fructilactobacillus lindneri DSM 20690 = JCM 11027 TaxID=1122148 RepID=A0A0R2K1M2_9LACO|nr:KUP/HAK/KT family potassium transporter [Fructilactobacillus lindneri]KRN80490.1 potassium transport system protein kup 2 [Fructilactobacillus lindneri DSM 20690 = JCM 11027]POH05138.1 potassium transporter Kup [Fructilactobacillus lindneri]POH05593.1 potassium transporter Kup [Fructilactobacillus lindneri]POH23128.1 potassium transporter Kup [Fructilactobacillus lindneri DSM 20690 = JCM 11027]SKA03531.1 KUP system potassium uptake protein [Fructilactobacillus lindneri DSM 20690 = JCM 11027
MKNNTNKITLAGMIIAIGIVYGDIGTSPLYVMNAVLNDDKSPVNINPAYITGSISLIFWTLMIITTFKYVILAMNAGNHGEGGIFSLYALVKKNAKWLIIPALIGGASILADGTLTPAVTVSSAVEGLKTQHLGIDQHEVLIITTIILLVIFFVQRFGTAAIGKLLGPIMVIWFLFLGVTGVMNIMSYPQIIAALSPVKAIETLFSPSNKAGIFILGSVFLATTGAEALYSDMGHVGKANIRMTWPFVYLALTLNYLGQGAWIVNNAHSSNFVSHFKNINPFYGMLPSTWMIFGMVIATLAAIIASQALITGSYTLVSEAMGLKLLPRMVIKHPGNTRSQIYIATVNWILCAITISVVWYFGSSEKMEAAYGLAITITMLMTTVLLFSYLQKKFGLKWALPIGLFFGLIEMVFFVASCVKFVHGGYITLIIMLAILYVMWIWYFGNKARERYDQESEFVDVTEYRNQLKDLSNDVSIPMYATNLVYMTKMHDGYKIKRNVMYSILDEDPKRAQVYWFVSVNETDVPYESNYTIDMMGTDNMVNVQLYLGFKKNQNISSYLHQIVDNLVSQGLIQNQVPKFTTEKNRKIGNFKFVIIKEMPNDLVYNDEIKPIDRHMIRERIFLQNITASPIKWFGLEFSDVVQEISPLFIYKQIDNYLVQRKIVNRPSQDVYKIKPLNPDDKDSPED